MNVISVICTILAIIIVSFHDARHFICFNVLCSGNFDLNQSFEIITDSSSDEDLPRFDNSSKMVVTNIDEFSSAATNDTLPLTVDVTFHTKDGTFVKTFPNNARSSVSKYTMRNNTFVYMYRSQIYSYIIY